MKLSASTIMILQRLSKVNKSIWIEEGNRLISACPRGQSMVAIANVDDEFSVSFGVRDIPAFLEYLSLFGDDHNIEFGENFMEIFANGTEKIVYFYAEKRQLKAVPPSGLEFELIDTFIKLTIAQPAWSRLGQAIHVTEYGSLAIVGKDGVLSLKLHNPRDPTSNVWSCEIGATHDVEDFNVVFNTDHIRKLPKDGDYYITLSDGGLSLFQTAEVSYYICPEGESVFPGGKRSNSEIERTQAQILNLKKQAKSYTEQAERLEKETERLEKEAERLEKDLEQEGT